MKWIIILFSLLFSICHVKGQSTYKQNLSDIFSVVFPSKPIQTDTMDCKTYVCRDSNAVYLAIIKNPITFLQPLLGLNLNNKYDGCVNGVLSATKGKLISRNAFEINGVKGVDIEYTTTINPNLPSLRFERFIFTNQFTFSFHFWTSPEHKLATKKERDRFFNSLLLIADKKTIQGNKNSAALMIGAVVGYLTAILMVLAFIGGGAFLVYKLSKKKRV
ncbi:hypothetical protein [Pedobacter frigoris]|uniref:hypothetical protein n=1 Tax=Pedobacter frigoris TaxID=2571272 RepID=UPI00292F0BCA|nr:hypothetical protein [Pedobacter frigoris]